MNITSCTTVVFSPTGTSRTIARSVASATGYAGHHVDVTYRRAASLSYGPDELLVVAVPVYGSHVAPMALQRMQDLRGDNTPAVAVVLYGNRAYGEALLQLSDFLAAKGFVTVAAGAFVGEHSYSSARYPIAAGRPDDADLAMAQEWGAAVRRKLDAADTIVPVDVSRMQEPQSPALSKQRFAEFIVSLQQGKSSPLPVAPTTDPDRCTHCGCCVAMCPAGAIVAGDEWHTDASLCIKCCACVKGCPAGARSFPTPFAPVLSQYFGERKPPVTIV